MKRAPRRTGRARFYHEVQLRGQTPSRLVHRPDGDISPDAHLVEAALSLSTELPFAPQSAEGLYGWHRFDWLNLLATLGEVESARVRARAIAQDWVSSHGTYSPRAWAHSVTAPRLFTMLRHADILLYDADAPWREAVLDLIARQTRHLWRHVKAARGDEIDLVVAASHSLAALCLPSDPSAGNPVSPGLLRSLQKVAQGDLPPRWRSIRTLADEADLLFSLGIAFQDRGLSPPAELSEVCRITRLALSARAASTDVPERWPAMAGDNAPDRRQWERIAPYYRPEADALLPGLGLCAIGDGQTRIWADLGLEGHEYAAGSIAVAHRGLPLIVNCGAPSQLAASVLPRMRRWRDALQATPATSARENTTLSPTVRMLRPDARSLQLSVGKGADSWTRRLVLGDDTIVVAGEDKAAPGSLFRFHLPASTTIEDSPNDDTVSFTTAKGDRYVFAATAGAINIEESIDARQDGHIANARQITVTASESAVQWSLAAT